MSNRQELFDLALTIPPFNKCDKQSLSRVLPNLHPITLQPGEKLFEKGQAAENLYLVVKGNIELHTDRDGKIQICHDFCGLEVVSGMSKHKGEAVATTFSEILALPKLAVQKLLANNPHFGIDLFLSIINRSYSVEKSQTVTLKVKVEPFSYYTAFGWIVTLLSPLVVLWTALDYGFNHNQALFMSILMVTISMWIFDLAEAFIPSLLTILAILILGLAPQEIALAGFSSDGFFMAMSVLGLGTLIVVSGLSYRFLLWTLKITPNNQFFYNFNLLITGVFLSPLLPSINGRTVLVSPLFVDTIELLKSSHKSPATNCLAMSTFVGVSLFSAIFMTSKSTNFIIYGLLSPQVQQEYQWVHWLVSASVVGIASLLLYAISAAVIFRNQQSLEVSKHMINLQLKVLGPMSHREWAAVGGIVLFSLGVVTASFHHIEPSWLALTLLFSLLLSGMLGANEFRQKVDWPFLILLGSMVGMVKTMNYLQLDDWLSSNLAWMGIYMRQNLSLFILMLTATLFTIRLVVPITAAIVITATVFIPLASAQGVNPWLIGFFILSIGESFYLPYQCSYYIQFQQLAKSGDIYDEKTFLLFNVWITIIKIIAIYVSLPFWRWQGII